MIEEISVTYSFSIVLHRVFDSAPPEAAATFFRGDREIKAHKKSQDLYAFTNENTTSVLIKCPGYLDETVNIVSKGLNHVFLYPSVHYIPPKGYDMIINKSEIDELLYFVEDNNPIQWDGTSGADCHTLKLKTPFVGGGLYYETDTWAGFVTEKISPNLYLVDTMIASTEGSRELQRLYAARADDDGRYALIVRTGASVRQVFIAFEGGIIWR